MPGGLTRIERGKPERSSSISGGGPTGGAPGGPGGPGGPAGSGTVAQRSSESGPGLAPFSAPTL